MSPSAVPELSLVIPCFNEEKCVESTALELVEAFERAGVDLELVLVDNGSQDGTGAAIDSLIRRHLPIVKATVPVNRGYGLGVLTGLKAARGRWVGHLCADGQVAAEDVVMIFECLRHATAPTLAKARRRYRRDSWIRKPVSIFYNVLMQVAFPGMPCIDVNGNPKIVPREIIRDLELGSEDWFIDAEMMLKARHLRLRVIEIDVFGRARTASRSHVRTATLLEFLRNVARYRFGGPMRGWCARTTPFDTTSAVRARVAARPQS